MPLLLLLLVHRQEILRRVRSLPDLLEQLRGFVAVHQVRSYDVL
jgi:hypothetical protein